MTLLTFGAGVAFGMWLQYKRFNSLFRGAKSAMAQARRFNDYARAKVEEIENQEAAWRSAPPILDMPALDGDYLNRMRTAGLTLFQGGKE